MAEIRCPMCGKPNPDDLEVCQFCHARLKPMRPTSPQDERQSSDSSRAPAGQPHEPGGEQDWLRQMRLGAELEDTPDSDGEKPFEQDDEPGTGGDDWLQRIRSLHGGMQAPGRHLLHWDTRDQAGSPVPAGIYFARLKLGERTLKQKIVVQR